MALFLFLFLFLLPLLAAGDPQAFLLNQGCSQYNFSSPSYSSDLSNIFGDLRSQLRNASHPTFVTATHARAATPIIAMFYCRDYLSPADCLSCFNKATAQIVSCGRSNGARAIYDGCFLRYESASFFDQATAQGNVAVCTNTTITPANSSAFGNDTLSLMTDLSLATPKADRFFAAAIRGPVFGVAQCTATVGGNGCATCLGVALSNIKACPPAAAGRAVDTGCFMRYSNVSFFGNYSTTDLAALLASSDGSSDTGAIVGGVVGGVCGILLIGILFLIWRLKTRKPNAARKGDILGATELQGPVNFRFKDLKSATKNFSDENKLGEGGFGDVYKGLLKNGNVVAVKKLALAQTKAARSDFESEVKLISNVHHRNLVRLLGCSSRGQELLLVYEYMANSSLDKFLFGPQRGALNWKQRITIIVGMARGLSYLHHEFHVCVIHRDIKPSNILLDDELQPKIADFGLARLLPSDKSHLSTKFAGTMGYTAPEYAIHGQLTEKVDTYSFGVVVLEILSGRKSNDARLKPHNQYILEWAWNLYENGNYMELLDESLKPDEYTQEEVKKVIEIALMCTQATVASRPAMSEVVILLMSSVAPVLAPTKPIFIDASRRVRGDTSTSTGSSASNAAVSITELSAR